MKVSSLRRLPIGLLLLGLAVPMAFAAGSTPEITQFGHDVRISSDQKVGDITCFSCSVYVRGQVSGDITIFHGNLVLEENGMIAGDVATFLGDVRADNETKIAGDVAVFGGRIRRQPEAAIVGDVTVMEGAAWVYLMLFSPFLVLAGIIALIVWLVRRRRPAPVMARAA